MINVKTLNKAIALTQDGHFKEAEAFYLQLLKEEPDNSILLTAFGLFYINIKNFEKASEYLERACQIQETLGTVSALGFSEFEQAKYEKSAEILEHALIYGENPDIYNKLIISLFQIKHYKKAIDYSAKMYQKYPQNTDAIAHMVKSLTQSGQLMEAEKLCVEYLKDHPQSASLWFHLGFLKELIYCNDKQACECYKMALENGTKEAYYNIAVSYQKQGFYDKAETYYSKMLEIFPKSNDTITSFGMCKLAQKKFKEGYDLFFMRDKSSIDKKSNNPWKPNENWGKEVVVLCDQGFGDHIQFIRYLPFLKEKIEKLYVASHPSLMELFQQNYPYCEFITYDEINPQMQSIRITDLAYALNMDFDNIPYAEGYLKSDNSNIKSDKTKVGLCWEAGSAGIRTMINRTINIKLFEPVLNLPNIQIYSFQLRDTLNGNEKYPQMINLAKDFKNFSDTAKALKEMDVVISVDTSVAHLAGALGVKTFLMLPYSSDWRWFRDVKTTPWYKSVEIFRQTDPISWEKPIEDIICKLKEYSL